MTQPLNRFTQALFISKQIGTLSNWYRSYSSFSHRRYISYKLPDLTEVNIAKEGTSFTSHSLKSSIKFDLNKLGEEAKVILKYCTFLGDVIPIELLKEILPDEERLNTGLLELTEKTELMQKVEDGTYSLQKDLQKVLRANVDDHDKTVSFVLKAIVDIFPNPQTYSVEEQKQAKRLLSCARVVAEAATDMAGINTELELLRHRLGNYYMHIHQPDKAVHYYEQSLTMRQEMFLEDHPAVANALTTLGRAYQACEGNGNALKGVWCFSDALAMFKRLFPGNHPDVATALNNAGVANISIGGEANLRTGLMYLEMGLNMRRALFQKDHLDTANSLNNVGAAYRDLGGEAYTLRGFKYLEEALGMFKSLCPDNYSLIARALTNTAMAYEALGDKNKALEYFKQSYGLWLASLGAEHKDTLFAKSHIEALQPDYFRKSGFVEKLQRQKIAAETQLGPECRRVILSHSKNPNENLMRVRQQIQKEVLNKVVDDCHNYGWHSVGWNDNHGVRAYFDPSFLNGKLGNLVHDPVNLRLAQMLCFEAMNIGIMKSDKKPYNVAESFCRINPELVDEIAKIHPEFFVDGSIVDTCVKAVPELAKPLAKNVKYMGMDKDMGIDKADISRERL